MPRIATSFRISLSAYHKRKARAAGVYARRRQVLEPFTCDDSRNVKVPNVVILRSSCEANQITPNVQD